MSQDVDFLMVCTANICRSPYAHLRLEQLLAQQYPDKQFRVESAGVRGFVNHPICPLMSEQLRVRGGDDSAFMSRSLTTEIGDSARMILTMEESHRRYILDNWPQWFRRTFVLGQFVATLNDEQMSAAQMVERGFSRRLATSRAFEVADPHGRGSQQAMECADRIDSLLNRLVSQLVLW